MCTYGSFSRQEPLMSLFPLVSVVAERPDLVTALSRRGCVPTPAAATPAAAADVLVVEAAQAADDRVRDALAAGRGVVVLGAPAAGLAGLARVTAREDAVAPDGA